MPKSEAMVTVNAPIEKVFDTIADQEKVAQYSSSSVLTGIKGKPDEPGSYADFDYYILGMTFHARITASEIDKPRNLIQEMFGTMPGIWT